MIPYIRYTLPNGLRIIHNYDPSVSMVAVDVLYNTGARDESRALTGIAHLFEHLMFGGSVNIPRFDTELENAGGRNNAWTSSDFTNFFDIVPAPNVETVFHLESDRMLAPAFSPEVLDVQRNVVIEEFKQQCLNLPYGDLMHGLRNALYSESHPYSWPVIGLTPDHVANATDEDVRKWFFAHYAPNNAVLAISGNLSYAEGRILVEKWFGDIPAREIAPRQLTDPGFPTENKTVEMHGAVPYPTVTFAIPMAEYGTSEYRSADCITDILSAGSSSRFFRRLVAGGDGSIIEADASITGNEHQGFVMLNAKVVENSTEALDRASTLMLEQLALLANKGDVSYHELERTFNQFESTFALSNLDVLSKAQSLALAEMHGEDINSTVALQRRITSDDIIRTAAKLSTTPHVKLYYRPNNSDSQTNG